ncbi:MAG: hypothetical protein DBX38_00070 [Eubacteriales Family XIII. Incertae Sedis bacterium]|nr:MAG: hypothetical protein DBX38_00070 [Clostridiales Family XIII bacterium]
MIIAMNIKAIIADAFLDLCEKKAITKIKIQDILDKAEVSRGTFHNHFEDKYDLIRYCYDVKVLPQWDYKQEEDMDAAEHRWKVDMLRSIRKYARFMKGACLMGEANCLREYIVDKGRKADLEWYKEKSKKTITKELEESIYYHSGACRYMIIEWILDDMPISEEKLADILIKNGVRGLY